MSDNNLTELQYGYLYGHSNRKNNFYKVGNKIVDGSTYNGIEDPILTGFTLSLDTLYSPLFKGVNEYSGVTGDSLADQIQTSLNSAWTKINENSSYTEDYITSMSSKDTFDDTSKSIGYGLQENVYNDELIYGAVDYIYMVDSTSGTVSKNFHEDASSLQWTKEIKDEADDDIKDETTETTTSDSSSESEVDKLKKQIETTEKELQELYEKLGDEQKIVDAYEKAKSDYETACSNISDFKTLVSNYQSQLSEIRSNTVDSLLNKDGEGINSIYNTYTDLKTNATNASIDVTSDDYSNQKSVKQTLANTYLGDKSKWKLLDTEQKQTLLTAKLDGNDHLHDLQVIQMSCEDELSSYEDIDDLQYTTEYNNKKIELEKLKAQLNSLSDDTETTSTTSTSSTIKTADTQTTTDVDYSDNTLPQTVTDMVGFITGFKKITTEYPYVFQTVSGLDEAYKKYFQVSDPYRGSGDDTISIACYESLDLKISSTFNKYFNAVYDREWRRERVPMNLRRFNCSIYVHDIRNFKGSLKQIADKFSGVDDSSSSSKIVELALNYLSVVEFKFYDCEIVPGETGNIFSEINNAEGGEGLMTNFTFKYGNCVINFLPFEDLYRNYVGSQSSSSVQTYEKNSLTDTESSSGNYKTDKYIPTDEYGNVEYNQTNSAKPVGEYQSYWWQSATEGVGDRYRFYEGYLGNVNDVFVAGISASTGRPASGVARELGLVYPSNIPPVDIVDDAGEIRMDTDVTGTTDNVGKVNGNGEVIDNITDLGELSSTVNLSGQTNDLGNQYDTPNVNGKTSDIDSPYGPEKPTGTSKDLGDLNDFVAVVSTPKEIDGDYDVSFVTGETSGLGDLNDSTDITKMINDLGYLSGDVEIGDNVLDLGNLKDVTNITNTTNELGTVTNNETDLGDDVSEIGQMNFNTEVKKMTKEVPNEISTSTIGDIVDEIGQIKDDVKVKDNVSEIGYTNITPETDKSNVSEIGQTSSSNITPTKIITEIGDVIPDDTVNSMITDLGQLENDVEVNNVSSNIGKQETDTLITNINSIGKLNQETKVSNSVNQLGKVEEDSISKTDTNDLGTIPQDTEVTDTSTDLGKQNTKKDVMSSFRDLGNVFRT
jgi:hypothetical protein